MSEIKAWDVVQIDPYKWDGAPGLGGLLAFVDEVKPWGYKATVLVLEGYAPVRLKLDQCRPVRDGIVWVPNTDNTGWVAVESLLQTKAEGAD